MKIEGEVRRVERVLEHAPRDGVHQSDAAGLIRGAKAVTIGGELAPIGMTSFLYRGEKVFYGLKHAAASSYTTVLRVMLSQRKMHSLGLALPEHGMDDVELRLSGAFGAISIGCYAYKTETVPMTPALLRYFEGKPYEWDGLDTPNRFRAFVDKALEKIRKHIPKSRLLEGKHWHDLYKIGNTLWHPDHQRYYIVDCG